jgi:hypothetical protein
MKLRVTMKINQWRCALQPLEHPLIIKHQSSRKEEREARMEPLWGKRSDRLPRGGLTAPNRDAST